jgi:hypothetical protein
MNLERVIVFAAKILVDALMYLLALLFHHYHHPRFSPDIWKASKIQGVKLFDGETSVTEVQGLALPSGNGETATNHTE